MRISIFGLGYVGAVSAGCLARRGHFVVGVDVSEGKVQMLASGKSPIMEEGLEGMLADAVAAGRLIATTDAVRAVGDTELSLICVGTPGVADGSPDLSAVIRVCEEIGRALRTKSQKHAVVLRSTTLPVCAEQSLIPALELHSGKKVGEGFAYAVNPEFLREGTAVHDFFHPPKTVIGSRDPWAVRMIESLYEGIDAPVFVTTPAVAMMVKYADNAFHASKVAFANEIGRICKQWGIDGQEVMELFCRDTKLNISPAYLRPAFAFGGSCLPKDVRALVREGEKSGASLPMLSQVLRSNDAHILEVVEIVRKTGAQSVGIFGLTFKSGTDDLRESAAVRVARRLADEGCEVLVHDPRISMDRLIGANRQYVEAKIPALGRMLRASAEEVVRRPGIVIVVDRDFDWRWAAPLLVEGQLILDVEGSGKAVMKNDPRYIGICW